MSSDSDDDIPIALLMKRKMEAERAKGANSIAVTTPHTEAKKPNTASAKNGTDSKDKKRPSNGDESTAKKSKDTKATPIEKKKESKPSVEKRKDEPKSVKKESKEDKKVSVSRVEVEENIFGLPRMDKHNLVSAVLRRWKYCLDSWPGELPKGPPQGYIESHIAGLYVGSSNLVLGQLKDMRPFIDGKTPSMKSLLTIKAVDLRDLLVKGVKKQLELLGTSPEDEKLKAKLRHELEKADKLKVKKIERKYREALAELKGEPMPAKEAGDKDDD